jgi:DNA invertase Pin-like site-specific DNA recombinase
MTRVAAYCRVSTDKDDQRNSFESQKIYFKEYIERREGWTLTDIYADEGITGTSTKRRDGFNRMIADARKGLFELVLTKEVSRFSRNILDAVSYTRLLKSLGIGVLFMNDGISTLEPDAELRLSIMASVAQEESRKTSERVKWGQRRQMERGVVFGPSLLGYTVAGGRISIEPQGAAIVREIYRLFTQERRGTRAIAQRLTDMGCDTAGGRTAWSSATVLKIIKNEKYCGDLKQRKTVTPDYLTHKKVPNRDPEALILLRDHHEPIVSRALWESAQQELRRRTPSGCPASSRGSRYALSGKVTCGDCGAPFICRTRKRSNGTAYRVWQSTCRDGLRQLREDWLVRQVRLTVSAYREGVMALLLPELQAAVSAPEQGTAAALSALRRLVLKSTRLADGYISGNISREDYLNLRERCKQQAAELALRLRSTKTTPQLDVFTTAEQLASGTDPDDGFYLKLVQQIEACAPALVKICLLDHSNVIELPYKSH